MTSRIPATVRSTFIGGVLSVVLLTPCAFAAESLEVTVDRASVIRAPQGTQTVVIGNPLIADASTQRNGVLVVTGKSYGSTNIMLLDGAGAVLSETIVSVRRSQDNVVMIHRGSKRESLSCSPRCEPVLAIGDATDTFSTTAGQISQRSGMSTSTGAAQ